MDNTFINSYKTLNHHKETKLLRVNASLKTETPEIPNRPIGLFGQLGPQVAHALYDKVHLPNQSSSDA